MTPPCSAYWPPPRREAQSSSSSGTIGRLAPSGQAEPRSPGLSLQRRGVPARRERPPGRPRRGAALAESRAGDVDEAVNWYAEHGRIATAPDREQVLDQVVAAWARDLAQGRKPPCSPGVGRTSPP